jgi:hypothetical protein
MIAVFRCLASGPHVHPLPTVEARQTLAGVRFAAGLYQILPQINFQDQPLVQVTLKVLQ